MIHKSPACTNPRLSIFGYLWQRWTFFQWHLPSCPGFFLSTGAFFPSTFDPISCPSTDASPLSFWQRPVEEPGNIRRRLVCVCLVSLQSGLAGCNLCRFVQWASRNGVQMPNMMSLGTGYFNSSLVCTYDLTLLGICLQEAAHRGNQAPLSLL